MDTSPRPALKDGFSRTTVAGNGQSVAAAYPALDCVRFEGLASQGFDALSLMARVRRVAEALAATPLAISAVPSPSSNSRSMIRPPRRAWAKASRRSGGHRFSNGCRSRGWPRPMWPCPGLRGCRSISPAEFALRAFLAEHLDLTLAHAARWVDDTDARVRRLASEGTRPL